MDLLLSKFVSSRKPDLILCICHLSPSFLMPWTCPSLKKMTGCICVIVWFLKFINKYKILKIATLQYIKLIYDLDRLGGLQCIPIFHAGSDLHCMNSFLDIFTYISSACLAEILVFGSEKGLQFMSNYKRSLICSLT